MRRRQSGILMHISSLAGTQGIGTLGRAAYEFVDFLERTKQSYWQVLPLGALSYGDSPYQSFSAFAGNTYFIDLDTLVLDGLLSSDDIVGVDFGSQPEYVDYAKIFEVKRPILEKAVQNFKARGENLDYQEFLQENSHWVLDFADYMAIKESFDLKSWLDWEDDTIRQRNAVSLSYYREKYQEAIDYHRVTQYFFFKQWHALKSYANGKGIKIIGDMPIYVSADSADMWVAPHYFKTDELGQPTVVAGCPPDAFSETGQLWGNPIYDWEAMAADGYDWWLRRLRESFKLYDVVRIDHFRGFEAYWEIPAGEATAVNGRWVKGPDHALFEAIQAEFEAPAIIAEDLGLITEEVIKLRDDAKLPGMKVLQFAFDSYGDSNYLPHHCDYDTVTYTGTHDNNTVRGWYDDDISDDTRQFFKTYSHIRENETPSQAMIRLAWASNSYLAITSMQDLLDLGSHARMNLPSTLGNNWQWRMATTEVPAHVEEFLTQLTQTYCRQNEKS